MEAFSTSRQWTSSVEASRSRARTSASPAAGPDWPENARVFGGSSQGSLGNYDPATSSLRTCQLSLLEDSTSSLVILPRAGSMRNGTIYRRQPLAPLTGGTASGSSPIPTPTAGDSKNAANATAGRRDPNSKHHSGTTLVDFARMWPTPKVSDANGHSAREVAEGNPRSRLVTEVQINPWPTPTARLGTAHGPQAKRYHDPARSNDLDDAVAASGTPGSLNPTFVEWLMGLPRDWTEV